MKTSFLVRTMLLVLLVLFQLPTFAQEVTISGKVLDAESKEALIGVSVVVKNTVVGTITNLEGAFSLKVKGNLPLKLSISMLGYATQDVEVTDNNPLTISLAVQAIMAKEVVVSASRVSEDILTSPVTIEKMGIQAMRNAAAPSFFDALPNQKGVDVITSSMLMKVINTRGFNAPVNRYFVTRVDGMDTQSPGFTLPLANILGVSDIDLDNAELIPGTVSALYGPNAFNGVLNITSRDPFVYQGLSAQVKTGSANINSALTNAPFYDVSFRYAKAFNNKFAFKVNLSYIRAEDWHADDMTDMSTANKGLSGANNPGRNAVNVYGDEVSMFDPISKQTVSRTGYKEDVLANYKTQNLRMDTWLHYRISDKLEASYMIKYADMTGIVHGGDRFNLDGTTLLQHRLELKGSNFYVRAYSTSKDMANAFDVNVLGNQLDAYSRKNEDWLKDYQAAYQGQINGYKANDINDARKYADKFRLQPGTEEFARVKSDMLSKAQKDGGARIFEKPTLTHLEGQWDLSSKIKVFDLLLGANYRRYATESQGTVYHDAPRSPGDTDVKAVAYYEYGLFAQASKKLLNDKLKLIGSIRYDKSQYFDGLATPRLAAVYTLGENSNFRVSYQTGFRNPAISEQFINLGFAGFTLIGGIDGIIANNPAQSNSFDANSVGGFVDGVLNDKRVVADPSVLGDPTKLKEISKDYYNKLKPLKLEFVKPERVQSFELGYKTLISNNLFLDFSYYYSRYENFIGPVAVMSVKTPVTDPTSGADILSGLGKVYVAYSNGTNAVYSHGFSGGVTYVVGNGYNISANATWSKLYDRDLRDPIIPAFNTPEYKTNLSIGNKNVYKNIGFNATWRWQESFIGQFVFAAGYDSFTPSFHNFDAQVSYKMEKSTLIKIGATNLTNQRYIQFLGNPSIGAMYYVSITFDPSIR